ncbi:MAG: hypothetical protein M0Z47_11945 [Actinomycetota bacterium]|nr:hypothetical protein [Actinomycetota bacterium]
MALAAAAGLAGCASNHTPSAPLTSPEPRTAKELLAITSTFNLDYAANDVGPVYARWDARSRNIISEAQYVLRHRECPSHPGTPVTESAVPSTGGWWEVHYSVDGVQLTDYWIYQSGTWRFDLIRSNPEAVPLYKLSMAEYMQAVGCAR